MIFGPLPPLSREGKSMPKQFWFTDFRFKISELFQREEFEYGQGCQRISILRWKSDFRLIFLPEISPTPAVGRAL